MYNICGKLIALFFPTREHIVVQHTTASTLAQHATETQVYRAVACLAPLSYKDTRTQHVLHALKFQNNLTAALLLAEVLSPFLAEELADRQLFGTFTHPLLLPIPLHPVRLRERGYNQSERIAQSLIKILPTSNITLEPALLKRTVNTPHQTKQHSKSDRLHNMRGVFTVHEPSQVQGKDILLLDDIITTGATLKSAHDALINAGAREVLCVAVAH